MDISSELWLRLIRKLKSDNIISFGSTIPYLIGAYKLHNQDDFSINKLLFEVINAEGEEIGVLQKCPNIGKYVLGIDDKDFCYKYMSREISLTNTKGEKRLIITQNASKIGSTFEQISNSLNREYMDCINGNKFSWCKRENSWTGFTFEQEQYIKGII